MSVAEKMQVETDIADDTNLVQVIRDEENIRGVAMKFQYQNCLSPCSCDVT